MGSDSMSMGVTFRCVVLSCDYSLSDPEGRVKLTTCELRHIRLFRKLVSRARIELATLSRQSHSSGPRHVPTLILLTERKVSVCSHPSRHRRTVNAADVHAEVQASTPCVIQFTKIIRTKVLAGAVRALPVFPLPIPQL